MRGGPADEGRVLNTFHLTEAESIEVSYDPRDAVVVWRELLTGAWVPLDQEAGVFAVSEDLVRELADAGPPTMHDLALTWAPLVDMDFHDAFAHLSALADLARIAVERGQPLYGSVA